MKICDSLKKNITQTHCKETDRLNGTSQVVLLRTWQCGFKANFLIW